MALKASFNVFKATADSEKAKGDDTGTPQLENAVFEKVLCASLFVSDFFYFIICHCCDFQAPHKHAINSKTYSIYNFF